MKYAAALFVAALGVSCASNPPVQPSAAPLTSPALLEVRLAEADALAARGCYVCLEEAAAAYSKLLQIAESPVVVRKTLENDLMIALREIELRLPDSGARNQARQLQEHVPADYDAYVAALDLIGKPLIVGGNTWDEVLRQRAERRDLAVRLEREWPGSPMSAYFYIAMAINAAEVADLKPQLSAILQAHSQDLSLKYRLQTFAPTFSEGAAGELLTLEPRFAEVHFLLGLRAILNAELLEAYRELTAAREGLPESLSITLAFGNLNLAFARYADSLVLFDQVLASGPSEPALLGRAIALSYLRRHRDAIVVLDELLKDVQSNPGDKYYWRAWNRLQQGDSQPAYDDARAALQVMASSDVYRLAGIASFNLAHAPEARSYFESSLKMNAGDCEALRYLGQLDAAERSWPSAAGRFSAASDCYRHLIERLSSELAEKQADTSGLLAGQIANLLADIVEAKSMEATSAYNAEVSARNAANRTPPAR
jgi:hypothetical protein